MTMREFVYMMVTLRQCDEQVLTEEIVARIYIAVVNFSGIEADDDGGASTMSFDRFVEAVCRCAQIKTSDGIVSLEQRLAAFFTNWLFRQARERTAIAHLWL